MIQINLFTKQEQTHRHRIQTYGYQRGKQSGRGINQEFVISRYQPGVCLVAQLCPTLCDPMACSPLGSSAHGILQARMLEWVACCPPGDLPDPGVKHTSPALQVDSLPLSHWGSPWLSVVFPYYHFDTCRLCSVVPVPFLQLVICLFINDCGTSLVVQWQKLRASTTGGTGL